jgi:hypothetical protein
MVRIKRWVMGKRKKVVWSEPQLPPFIKINPESPPGLGEGLQPGDLSMGAAAQEFLLTEEEGEGEPVLPAPGLHRRAAVAPPSRPERREGRRRSNAPKARIRPVRPAEPLRHGWPFRLPWVARP